MHKILITGGAGFIGRHLALELLSHGYAVRALDALVPWVHGPDPIRPRFLDPRVELQVGDLRDPAAVDQALEGVDAVLHLAARAGVGRDETPFASLAAVNCVGTAVLLERMLARSLSRLVVASSQTVYGEGLYRSADDALVLHASRSSEQLRGGAWEPYGPRGEPLEPLPTPESKPAHPVSIPAITLLARELLCMVSSRNHEIRATALRLSSVYGPHQLLSNPDAGMMANFSARLLCDLAPLLFEDGRQQRDLVHVRDVARALRLALESPGAVGQVLNIGSGAPVTVLEAAHRLAEALGRDPLAPVPTGEARAGDVRHCFGEVEAARAALGFSAQISLDEGLKDLVGWLHAVDAIALRGGAPSELEPQGPTP